MHEEALLQDLVRKVAEVGRANGLAHVGRVRIWVGAFSHLREGPLRAQWALATAGTVADGSSLDLEASDDPTDPRASEVILRSVSGSAGGSTGSEPRSPGLDASSAAGR